MSRRKRRWYRNTVAMKGIRGEVLKVRVVVI